MRIERLGRLIEPEGTQRILQIYGPAGMGKTTLLANHAVASHAPARRFRWLSLQTSNLRLGAGFGEALEGALLTWDARSDAGRSEVLVVDAGALDPEPVAGALADLVLRMGPDLQLWVVSRRPSQTMLARLGSPHLVRTLDPEALLFDPDEAKRHFSAARTGDITRGWPLAEAVAAAISAGDVSTDRLLDHAGGLLEATIRDSIWDGLSPATRALLAETAMIEQVEQRFISRITAPLPATPVLEEIAAMAPLSRVRRGAGGGFSLHPVLRAFALRQLERGELPRRHQAYRQALLHHAERRAPEAAIAIVQNTGDESLARMAFEAFTSTELLRASGYNRLRNALAQLAPDSAERSGQICITQAVVAMKEGQFAEARRLLESARKMLSEDMAYQSPSLSRVYADFIIAQHVLAFHAHTELSEAQLSEGYFWSIYTNDLTNAAFVYALRSLHYLRRGDLALAQEQIVISREKYERATSYYGLGSAILVDGMIALAGGRLERAAALATEARMLIARAMPDDAGLMAVAECVLCEVEFERGRLDGLFERIDAALRDLEACDGWPDAFVIGYRVGARAAAATGGGDRALGLLDRAIRLMRGRGLSDIERYCRILRAGVLSKGASGAQGWRSRDVAISLFAPAWIGWRESDEATFLDGQEALETGEDDRVQGIATTLADSAALSGRRITVIRALVLFAGSAFQAERPDEAVASLERAIGLAEAEAVMQPFIEHGPALLLVLEAMKAAPAYRTMARGTRSFCASLARTITARSQAIEGGPTFVPRELQIIRCLVQRQANKAIARELGLSASAVKFHLANIYRKLGVNKRNEAAVEAQRRGLGLRRGLGPNSSAG
ncbi:LuxR family maltose regulon positive regulatory protein [Sphingomonas zeicaulis]|uniref:LuxR C-terminal-related transcriptional regulator n=1 Tax=Sphingomonas zeicaulis TaxID=1632740 RepID=UPI003D256548